MSPGTFALLLSYLGVTAVLVVSPGMSTALVLRNTAEGGRRAGVITALGIACGNASWALAAGIGLSAVLSRAPGALTVIRVAGACGLVWLGARSMAKAWMLRRAAAGNGSTATLAPHVRRPNTPQLVVEGFLTNALNPAIPVFYLGTVPQFVTPGMPFGPWFALLGSLHVVMAFGCHVMYVVAGGRMADALAARGRAWVMHAVTGATLVAVAVQGVVGLLK